MTWRRRLLQFGIRFAVLFVLLGGIYIARYGLHLHPKSTPPPPQGTAALRSDLAQVYLTENKLSTFEESGITASDDLNSLSSLYYSQLQELSASLKSAPRDVPASTLKGIGDVNSQMSQAGTRLKNAYTSVKLPLAYNPESDLAGNLPDAAVKVAGRAQAAAKGLTTAANATPAVSSGGLGVESAGGPPSALSDKGRQALQNAGSCFNQLSEQLAKKQFSQAEQTRSHCIADYPAVRKQIAKDLAAAAFPASLQADLQVKVPALLRSLDSLKS